MRERDWLNVVLITALAAQMSACENVTTAQPPPEGTATNPTETVLLPSVGTIPTSAAETATATSVQFLGQEEVLATKLSETLTLENLYAKFEADTQIKALFANPDAVEYSAMGIKAYMAESGKTVTYPFFSAMSETEKKGYTAMVLQPSAEEVIYQVLNRITDAEGKVGLGITQDLNHQLLEKPVMIFAAGLTADQIAKMTDEELSRINLLFVPAGLPVSPSEAPLGVGNYLASLKPVEPAQTPTPAIPQEILSQFPDASIGKTESGWEARDSQGSTIGWYDTEVNEWIMRYETLFEISEYPPNPDWLHFDWIKKEGGFVATDEGDELASRNVVFAGRVKKVFTEMVPNSVGFTKIYWMTMTYGNGDKTVNVLLFAEHNKTLLDVHSAGWLMILDKDNPDYYGPFYIPEKDHYSQEQVLTALKKSYFIQVRIGLYREKYLSDFKNSKYLIDDNFIYRSGYLQSGHFEEQLQLVDALLGGNFEGVKDGIPLGADGTWIFTSP